MNIEYNRMCELYNELNREFHIGFHSVLDLGMTKDLRRNLRSSIIYKLETGITDALIIKIIEL